MALFAGALPGPAFAAGPAAATATCSQNYTVVAGDTLSKIALAYKLTVAELAAANNLTSPYTLYVGQVLCIPGSTTSTGTTTSSTTKNSIKLEVSGTRIIVTMANFTAKRMFYVKIGPDRPNPNDWNPIGRIKTSKTGAASKSFRIPKNLIPSNVLTVCLKNVMSDAVYCKEIANPNRR
jgi:murein DD-endopeptidase MepM/ murein hydrolase activator NlpD